MPARVISRALMYARRLRYWAGQFHWWAVLALVAGLLCVYLAFSNRGLGQVLAVGALSITLAILATREEPSP